MIGKPIYVGDDESEAYNVMEQYVKSTGNYAKVEGRPPEKGSKKMTYIVLAYEEPCHLQKYINITHTGLRELQKYYLEVVKRKVATERILKHLGEPFLAEALEESLREKKRLIKAVEELVKKHPIYKWCRLVNSGRHGKLGAVAALDFLGGIDPHECINVGRVKAIFGFTPEGTRKTGKKVKGRLRNKGRAWFHTENIIKGKDSYYYPLYLAKKEWYKKRGVTPDAKAHNKAIFWLAGLIVSHAAQIIREAEGYQFITCHNPYIPPKSREDEEPPEELLEAIRNGAGSKR